jgi:pimeloyl-ACP methyl ester carboxylesterase
MALDLSLAIPDAEFQVIPGAGHGCQFMVDLFNARLRGFMGKA